MDRWKISLVSLKRLRQHEKIREKRLKELLAEIRKENKIKDAIIVDKKTMIILDGHHRYNAAKKLRLKKIPAYLVDYMSREVRLYKRRKNITVNKENVVDKALKKKLFPPKTTKHALKRPKSVNVPLSKLK